MRNILFISYAREDRDICTQVAGALSQRAKRLGYEIWWDQSQRPGQIWSRELASKLDQTGAAIVLVSNDSLRSEYIWEKEVGPLLRDEVPVAPLLVRPCDWEVNEQLEELQFLNPAGPESNLTHDDDSEATLAQISRSLAEWLPSIEDEQSPDAMDGSELRQPIDQLPVAAPGTLHAVPSLPADYLPREGLLDDFRSQLLQGASGAAAITTPPRIGLFGSGGVGKSVLASALAHDIEIRRAFPDGVYWVTVGERPDIPSLQARLAEELGVGLSSARTNTERRRMLADSVTDRRCLIIVDDVWSGEGAVSFNIASEFTRVLFTTRIERLLSLPEIRATPLVVAPLSPDEAVQFVETQIAELGGLPPAALDVIEQTGRVIFALTLAVGAYLNGLPWDAVRERFAASTRLYPEELDGNLRAMRVAMSTLTEEEVERYCDLVVFPSDEPIPVRTIDQFWRDWGVSTTELLRRFQAGRLLEVDASTVRLHDDQLLYLSGRTRDQTSRHAELLSAHRPISGEWRDLPHDDPYMWNHLASHLVRAAAFEQDYLSSDLDWLSQHWFLNGPSAVERDLALLAAYQDAHHVSNKVLRRMRRLGHLMLELPDLASVSNTIAIHFADLGETDHMSRWANRDWLSSQFPLDAATDALEKVVRSHSEGALGLDVFYWKEAWHLACVGTDSALRVWNVFRLDEEPTEFTGHEGWVNAVHAFNWRGDWHCATGGDDRKIRVWNLNDPQAEAQELSGPTAGVIAISGFEEDGDYYLCAGSRDQYVRVFRLSTGHISATYRGHSGKGHSVVVHSNGRQWLVTSGGSDAILRTWNPLSGARPETMATLTCGKPITALTTFVSAEGRGFAAGHPDGSVSIARADGQVPTSLQVHAQAIHSISTFEDGDELFLVTASEDGAIAVRSASGRSASARSFEGHLKSVQALRVFYTSNGHHLASASMDGSIRIWDLRTIVPDAPHADRHSRPVRAITECAFRGSPAIATASEDGDLRVWLKENPQVSARVISHPGQALTAACGWPDDNDGMIAWGSREGLLGVVSASGRTTPAALARQWSQQSVGVSAVCCYYQEDGHRMLASASPDRAVRIWDTDNPSARMSILRGRNGHQGHVNDICSFHSLGRPRVLSASSDKTMRMWDPTRTEGPLFVQVHTSEVTAVAAFSDDSGWNAVTGANDGVVRMISLETEALPRELGQLDAAVSALAVIRATDGFRIVAGASDGRVGLWDPRGGGMTVQVRLGEVVSDLASTTVIGEIAVAYDAGWALLKCSGAV